MIPQPKPITVEPAATVRVVSAVAATISSLSVQVPAKPEADTY